MTVTRKPTSSGAINTVDIEALINKGGSVASDAEPRAQSDARAVPVVMRIPRSLLTRIDALVATRQLKTPRHTWLLEALLEQVSREESAR
jgi:hypothetical protein